MIDAMLFARWIRVFGERIGKPLSADTSAAYYATLSEELTTGEFDAAMQRIFRDHIYATWPSPKAIIACVKPTAALQGLAAWTAICEILRLRPANATAADVHRWIAARAGEAAATTFDLVGGMRRYMAANDWRFEEMQRDFLDRSEDIGRLNGSGHAALTQAARGLLPGDSP